MEPRKRLHAVFSSPQLRSGGGCLRRRDLFAFVHRVVEFDFGGNEVDPFDEFAGILCSVFAVHAGVFPLDGEGTFISGAVQFAAGMNGSELIGAINTDPDAPLFNIAHVGIVGDVYEIVPKLAARIKAEKGNLK